MPDAGVGEPPAPRYRVERARSGYRVIGPALLIWEPSLGETVQRREELEALGWRYPLAAPIAQRPEGPFESIVYGPLRSRRLGRSLGLSLTPAGCRVCNFECVYCPYMASPARSADARWPKPEDVGARLAEALAEVGALDSITISGHGEPTLHPRFAEVVARVLAEARWARPRVPVRILTNGSRVVRPEVRDALDRLDERVVKLDADPERVSRPTGRYPLGAIVFALTRLRDVTLQSCFIEGAVSNTGPTAIHDWAEVVAEIHPRGVQIYTIDRQPGSADIRPVSAAQLEEIACKLRARTGIEASVYA